MQITLCLYVKVSQLTIGGFQGSMESIIALLLLKACNFHQIFPIPLSVSYWWYWENFINSTIETCHMLCIHKHWLFFLLFLFCSLQVIHIFFFSYAIFGTDFCQTSRIISKSLFACFWIQSYTPRELISWPLLTLNN